MSTKVEQLEKSRIKLTIEVSAERFEEGMKHAYNKNKNKIVVPGFRKGKAPRKMVERSYGKEIFYEDAANFVIPDAYDEAVKENNLDVVSRPEIEIEQIESGKDFIFKATVAVKPEVKLGQYKELEIEKADTVITDADVEDELNKTAEKNSRMISITDRAIENQDQVTIDFEGFVEGKVFEGGKAENYSLIIGSHSFIDNFEEQLIGKNIDDEVEVNVTFPEDYNQKDLAGKPALFKVKIKEIKVKELPVIDDEFAKDVSEFDTLEEYKADIKVKIKEKAEKTAEQNKEEKLIEKVVQNTEMDVPDEMIDSEVNSMVNNFESSLKGQGMALEQYLSIVGSNIDTFKESLKPEAEKRVKGRLVLEAVAKAENIEVTKEELDEEIKKMAEMYNIEFDEIIKNIPENEKESIEEDIKVGKALDLIVETAKEM